MSDNYIPEGVTFDGMHSYSDFGLWLKQRPNFEVPTPKTSSVDIPGADGNIDLTEANTGEVKYNNRTITLQFSAMVNKADQPEFCAAIMNYLHGRRINRIIFDNDPEWFWAGRASVSFDNVSAWKLDCTVTIDASPYAMKIDQTVIDFTDYSQADVDYYRIDLTGNVSGQEWNSVFEFGTMDFPTGIPTDNQQELRIEWGQNPTIGALSSCLIQIVDSSENVYNQRIAISTVQSTIEISIPFSDITASGVDMDKIYRVLVSNIGGCSIYVQKQSVRRYVDNTRKTVMPDFVLKADDPVNIVVNGTQFAIEVGNTSYDNIVLRQGRNEIYVPTLPGDVSEFTMTFREGKL